MSRRHVHHRDRAERHNRRNVGEPDAAALSAGLAALNEMLTANENRAAARSRATVAGALRGVRHAAA